MIFPEDIKRGRMFIDPAGTGSVGLILSDLGDWGEGVFVLWKGAVRLWDRRALTKCPVTKLIDG
jgi:hypothetical protein